MITDESIFIFDLDGTLVDTNYSNFLAYKKAVKDVLKFDFNPSYNPGTRFNRDTLKLSFPNLPDYQFSNIVTLKSSYFTGFLPETKLIESTALILYKYCNTNRTILVTKCQKQRAEQVLNYHGLKDKFSDLFFNDYSEHNKTSNKFQNAITQLGLSPDLIIAFEDEDCEISDAQKAGIKFINSVRI